MADAGKDDAPPTGSLERRWNRRQTMMVVVFRARRTPEGESEEYRRWFLRMSELARKMPGYVSHKGYVAEDGERLTLVGHPSGTSPGPGTGQAKILHAISSPGLRARARIEIRP